jgi:coproporphyrinogen III oxidase-like Fe-S oxidoreductase
VTASGRVATATERHPEAWLDRVERAGHGFVEDTLLTLEEEGDEFLLMGLRLREGVDPARYLALTGRPLDRSRIRALEADGLIAQPGRGRLAVTPAGFPVLDAVVADLAA